MRSQAIALAVAIAGAMVAPASSATVTATNGLAPQFAKWSVPIYSSHVSAKRTFAPTSYEIVTSDSPATALAWYRQRLGSRATLNNRNKFMQQLAVDGASYVINVEKSGRNTSINVIKI